MQAGDEAHSCGAGACKAEVPRTVQPPAAHLCCAGVATLAGRRFFEQIIEVATGLDRLDDSRCVGAGSLQRRIGRVRLGLAKDFGVEHDDVARIDPQRLPVGSRQRDPAVFRRDQHFAFMNGITHLQRPHDALGILGKNLALKTGYARNNRRIRHDVSQKWNDRWDEDTVKAAGRLLYRSTSCRN